MSAATRSDLVGAAQDSPDHSPMRSITASPARMAMRVVDRLEVIDVHLWRGKTCHGAYIGVRKRSDSDERRNQTAGPAQSFSERVSRLSAVATASLLVVVPDPAAFCAACAGQHGGKQNGG
jgi:hypothetical protein